MAPSVGTLRVGRYFMVLLLIFLALYAVVGFGSRHTPKLGIDLVGGKRAIFIARTNNGSAPTSQAMSQARQIIENRVNAQGVTGATVQVQNNDQLVVIIPGGTQGDVQALGQPAVLNFRGLVMPAVAVTCTTTKASKTTGSSSSPSATTSTGSTTPSTSSTTSHSPASSASSGHSGSVAHDRRLVAAKSSSSAAAKTSSSAAASGTTSATASSSSSTTTPVCTSNPFAALVKSGVTVPTSQEAYSKLSSTQQTALTSALASYKCSSAIGENDLPHSYYLACDSSGYAYLLGTVIVRGDQVSSASAQAPSTSGQSISGDWSVQLNLDDSGSAAWATWTKDHHFASPSNSDNPTNCSTTATTVSPTCADYVAFTLNGGIVSSPITTSEINGLATSITGTFDQTSADNLAEQLNYGSLPLSFRLQSNEDVSATLGTVQLKGAFLAGGIGLILVVLYSLAYYRGLGLVTIGSLLVSAGLTFAMLVILGTQIGFTLDLAGIAGFIVALGITADSFVVFFERIKDEVHEGRSMRVAVPRAWIRARRTILSADTVSFLAAAILYYFASADVKGFAFTLGLSTILDLVVVFLFTHPIVSLLSRSRAFGSPRFTGLNSVRSGTPVSDDDADLPERRSARQVAGTARERASGRRGMAVRKDDTPAGVTTVADDTGSDDTRSEDVESDNAESDDGVIDVPEAPRRPSGSGPSGGTAAERAAARRARRRENGSDNEGTS